MVEVYINNQKIDILETEIKYVKQVNDLADVTTVNTSYSYSLTVKKTPKNTLILKGLGLVGDTSDIPYTKNRTQVIDNGAMIVPNGISYVKTTDDNYKLVIQDGIVDFFRAIENKTIGNDLDLSELFHAKTDVNIIASFTNPNYRYLISDYNGKTIQSGAINPDYQVPSINFKYLWDKIMAFAGYTYENLPDISGDWMAYGTPPAEDTGEDVLIFEGEHDGFFNTKDPNGNDTSESWKQYYIPTWNVEATYLPANFILIHNWKLQVVNSNAYKATFNAIGTMKYRVMEGNIRHFLDLPVKFTLRRNGVYLGQTIGGTAVDVSFTASAGQLLELRISALTAGEAVSLGLTDQLFIDALGNGNYTVENVDITSVVLDVYSRDVEYFDFSEAFSSLSMTDFVKVVMFRKSLTPFPDVNEKHIVFKTLSERLDTSEYVDWSNKFIDRKSETYDFGYAKENLLLMRHDNDNETFGNGTLRVNNENLKDYKNIFQSLFYAPTGDLRSVLSKLFFVIPFWDRTIKDDMSIEYKPLKNRYYLLREDIVVTTLQIGGQSVDEFPKASITGTMLSDVVEEYYSEWGRIFDNLRIHSIEVLVNSYDFATLQMDVPYYFKQEGAMYLLNKLSYESGKPATGEFLRFR